MNFFQRKKKQRKGLSNLAKKPKKGVSDPARKGCLLLLPGKKMGQILPKKKNKKGNFKLCEEAKKAQNKSTMRSAQDTRVKEFMSY